MERRESSVLAKRRAVKLVSLGTLLVLAFVGLLAVLEQGPPATNIYLGASPLNTGLLGTSDLYIYTKSIYPRSFIIYDWARIPLINCGKVLIVIISPEKSFGENDINGIKDLVSRCGSVSFLIADESTYSNTLLSSLGSSLRISGKILVETIDQYKNNSFLQINSSRPIATIPLIATNTSISTALLYPVPQALYPIAEFNMDNSSVELRLDIASYVEISNMSDHETRVLGFVSEAITLNQSFVANNSYIGFYTSRGENEYFLATFSVLSSLNGSFVFAPESITRLDVARNISIAVYESFGKTRFIVFGDGSIFLNQVLRSGYNSSVLRIYRYSIDTLCSRDPNCIILFDASRYNEFDPAKLITQPGSMRIVPLEQIVAYMLAKMIHPATWVPMLFSWLNNFINDLLGIQFIKPLMIILIGLVASLVWLRREIVSRDTVYQETIYRDILHFEDLVNSIRRGRVRLSKKDFINLYEYVNEIFRNYLGSDLSSSDLSRILSENFSLDKEFVERYQRYMVSNYRRARGEKIIYRIIPRNWNRICRRAAEDTLRILREIEKSLGGLSGYV